MMWMRNGVVAVLVVGIAWCGGLAQGTTNYHLLKQIQVGREGGQDYLNIDQEGRRLYVSHGTTVEVVDIDRDVFVGRAEWRAWDCDCGQVRAWVYYEWEDFDGADLRFEDACDGCGCSGEGHSGWDCV